MKNVPQNELFSAYLDGELSAEEQAQVEQLLATSPAARQLLAELRALSGALQSLPEHRLANDLSEQVLRRAERRMLGTGAEGPARTPAMEHSSWRTVARRLLRPRTLLWPAAAVAVAVLLSLLPANLLKRENGPTVALKADRDGTAAQAPALAERESEFAERRDRLGDSPAESAPASAAFSAVGDAEAETGGGTAGRRATQGSRTLRGAGQSATALAATEPAAPRSAEEAGPRGEPDSAQTLDELDGLPASERQSKAPAPGIMARKEPPTVADSMSAERSVAAPPKLAKSAGRPTGRAEDKHEAESTFAAPGDRLQQVPQAASDSSTQMPLRALAEQLGRPIPKPSPPEAEEARDARLETAAAQVALSPQEPAEEWNEGLLDQIVEHGQATIVLQCAVTPEVVEQRVVERILREQQIEPRGQQTLPGTGYDHDGMLAYRQQAAMPDTAGGYGYQAQQPGPPMQQIPDAAAVQNRIAALGMGMGQSGSLSGNQQQAFGSMEAAVAGAPAAAFVIDAEATAGQINGLIAALKQRPAQFPQVFALLPHVETQANAAVQTEQSPAMPALSQTGRLFIVQQAGPFSAGGHDRQASPADEPAGERPRGQVPTPSYAAEQAEPESAAPPMADRAEQQSPKQQAGADREQLPKAGSENLEEQPRSSPKRARTRSDWGEVPRRTVADAQRQAARYQLHVLVQVMPPAANQAGQTGLPADQAAPPSAAAAPRAGHAGDAASEGNPPTENRTP